MQSRPEITAWALVSYPQPRVTAVHALRHEE